MNVTDILRAASFGLIGDSDQLQDPALWPKILQDNISILSAEERALVVLLLREGQHHLFDEWDALGVNDDKKHALLGQIYTLHTSYNLPGGLSAYLKNARSLLAAAKNGDNPMAGWVPEVPVGVDLDPLSEKYDIYEQIGLDEVGLCGFVLVAGGLGERLGYDGIKVELPTQMTTGVSYLELYCKQILHMQQRYVERLTIKLPTRSPLQSDSKHSDTRASFSIPLAIMVSDDTYEKTIKLLESHHYYGLEKYQVTVMKQEKVAALLGNTAKIAMTSAYEIDSKPHGHGDVHSLMHSTGTAARWRREGVRWVVFFQDTNGLAFQSLAAMIGVSKELRLQVNSLAIPRVAKQAIGAIVKLTNKTGMFTQSVTVNVEYNQLEPLLRATISRDGDVNDASTGRSPFPGNINQLLFQLDPYVTVLAQTRGVMAEFVNPKYADETKTVFKKPTRLECMMQDYPKVLDSSAKVGFTTLPSWICFSPCKNNSADAAVAVKSGVPAASAYTAECDQYFMQAELLRRLGCHVASAEPVVFLGVRGTPGPRIVISSSTAIFASEFRDRFPNPASVKISSRSSLVVEGDVIINTLNLDGALYIRAVPNTRLFVNMGKDAVIRNSGHSLREIDVGKSGDWMGNTFTTIDKMRGYVLQKQDEEIIDTASFFDKNSGPSANSEKEFVYIGVKQLVPFSSYVDGLENRTCSPCWSCST